MALQEVLKGRVTESDFDGFFNSMYRIGGREVALALDLAGLRAGNLMGSKYGGWGFNSYWDIGGPSSRSMAARRRFRCTFLKGISRPRRRLGSRTGIVGQSIFLAISRRATHNIGRWICGTELRDNCWRKPSRQGRLRRGRIDWQTIRTLKLVKPVST